MTEVPEFMRAAMEAAGVDPDEVAEKAAEIEEAGGVDALYLNEQGRVARRPVDEPETEPLFEMEPETAGKKDVERDNE